MKLNRTMNALKGILEASGVRVKHGEPFTHVSKASPHFLPGSYYISTEEENNFLIAVCNAVRSGAKLTIAEKGQQYAPLRVDFDFQADIQFGTERFYTEGDVKCLVKYYQDEIKAIIDPKSFRDEMLMCIVLEKENARVEDGKVKDGFHFHFPHFVCEGKVQDIYIRDKVMDKLLANTDIFTDEGIITPKEKILDRDMAKKPWMMYGSMNFKSNESTPYLYNRKQPLPCCNGSINTPKKDPWSDVTKEWGHAYDHNLNEVSMYSVFMEEMDGRKQSVRYYLPMLMSTRGFTETTPLKPEIERKIYTASKPKRKGNKVINKNRSDKQVYEDLKKITDGHIMEMISEERANNYDDWIDVGFILFNIANGKEEGLNMWIEFSQRSAEKYKPGECEEFWETMDVRNKTIGGLLALARTDSPEAYKRWKNTNKYSFLEKSLHPPIPNPFDVAMVAVANADGRFLCINPKKDIWMHFDNHRWNKSNDALDLKRMLVDEIIQDYYDYRADLAVEGKDRVNLTDVRQAEIKDQDKKIWKIIDRLKNVIFQDHVIKMCKLRLTDENFHKKANENTMLMCCENGVIDLELGIFRDGRPDDYCTFSTGLYYEEYDKDDSMVANFDECILKIFPNPNLHGYFYDMAASCMEGGNVNKRIFICTGESNGGKSFVMKLIETCFGEYFGKFPRELFIRGRGGGANDAKPALMKAESKRIMSTQELTHMDNFDIGVLKEGSGNDSVSCRGLYQEEMRDISFQYTTILQCNEPPKIPGHDEPTWSRVRLVDFESRFVIPSDLKKYPVPDTFDEQMLAKRFHADTNIRKKMGEFAKILLWKLFRHYGIYKKRPEGLIDPPEVMLSTDNYKTKNDVYRQFYEEKMEKVNEEDAKKAYVSVNGLCSEFKDWFFENHPSYKKDLPGAGVIKKEMIKRTGQIKDKDTQHYGFGEKNRFWGYRIIYDDDDDETERKLGGNKDIE
jgi:phage/plasmid-associated DNA primase